MTKQILTPEKMALHLNWFSNVLFPWGVKMKEHTELAILSLDVEKPTQDLEDVLLLDESQNDVLIPEHLSAHEKASLSNGQRKMLFGLNMFWQDVQSHTHQPPIEFQVFLHDPVDLCWGQPLLTIKDDDPDPWSFTHCTRMVSDEKSLDSFFQQLIRTKT